MSLRGYEYDRAKKRNCHAGATPKRYDTCKKKLAAQFANDRGSYIKGKLELIGRLLNEAHAWRSEIWVHEKEF